MPRLFDDIMTSLNELKEYAEGKPTGVIVNHRKSEIILSYKGHTGTACYYNDDGIYHGKLSGTDLMTFGGETEADVNADFMALIDSIEKAEA